MNETQNHKIIECLKLERTGQDLLGQLPGAQLEMPALSKPTLPFTGILRKYLGLKYRTKNY